MGEEGRGDEGIGVDLAELLVFKGQPQRAADLVEQCYPVLKSWGLHSYALAAWLVFRDSLAQRRMDSVFTRMREYFRRHGFRLRWSEGAANCRKRSSPGLR